MRYQKRLVLVLYESQRRRNGDGQMCSDCTGESCRIIDIRKVLAQLSAETSLQEANLVGFNASRFQTSKSRQLQHFKIPRNFFHAFEI